MNLLLFLLMPIVLIFVITMGIYAVKREHKPKPVFFTGKKIKWLFSFYVIVLVIGCITAFFIPVKQVNSVETYTDEENTKATEEFYDNVYSGQIEDIENIQQLQYEQFSYQGSELHMKLQEDEFIDEVIVVEQKQTNDELVEVAYYSTRTLASDAVYSQTPFFVTQEQNTLLFSFPEQVEIEFAATKQPFTVSQFSGEDWFSYSYRHLIGQNVIYVKIPKDVQLIVGEDFPVYYMND
ncbi:hypothetical protein [Alkalihalobacillus sp. LMS39]|uniref:hypothetical protein n=1 Tax=Alkalihalobacillus sp. LMS39 TaxID=2924032 RepID=UPI001FB51D0B|nr:hypothetical protein [Alkalihalobacillus sp. LMS39]UOE96203.1 hypothetical protein MM271_11625 [Alkalihalobacillus sp. LMS39]